MTDAGTDRIVALISALFVLQPGVLGAWFAAIPEVQASLGLTKAELALALVGMPAAVLPGLSVAGRVVGRFGPRRVFIAAFPAQAAAAILPLLAWSALSLFFALAVFGLALAFLEVCLNVYAGRTEKRTGRVIMNRCHGFWAVGLTFGSLAVTAAPAAAPALALVAVATAVPGMLAARALPRLPGEEPEAAPPRRSIAELPPALFAIAGFMLVATMAEGAMADWSAIYIAERLGGETRGAGVAVTIFTAALAAGRFAGDRLTRRLGPVRLARGATGLALAGLGCLVLPLPLAFAVAGFALVGLGVSVAYPLGVSAVARVDDRFEAANIALMSTVAFLGLLVGPPLIGFLAEAFGLRIGLAALIPGLLLAIPLARALGAEPTGVAPPPGPAASGAEARLRPR